MLKEAKYRCWGYGRSDRFPEYNRVVYVIVGDKCYFSGIELGLRTSTMNAAESIVQAICDQEGCNPREMQWFDLLTRRGYEEVSSLVIPQPGDFVLSELCIRFDGQETREAKVVLIEVGGEQATVHLGPRYALHVTGWPDRACPPEIIEIFREYIGPNPRNVGEGQVPR